MKKLPPAPDDTPDNPSDKETAPAAGRPRAKVNRTRARRLARERALQALYQWDLSSASVGDIRREFHDRATEMTQVDIAYFEAILSGVTSGVAAIDETLQIGLDRPVDNLDPIERAVLRLAVFELSSMVQTPARVVINEAIEITKRFGADKGHTYINGVLDKVAPSLRPTEMSRR